MVSVWLRSLEEVEETVLKWSAGLESEGFWWTPGADVNSIGGLVRHIGGASERLMRYAQGQPIPEELRRSGAQELSAASERPEVVLDAFYGSLSSIKAEMSDLTPEALQALHPVGRAAVPTKAAFILHHLIEHAQHHAGQLIVMRKLWNLRAEEESRQLEVGGGQL